MTQIKSASATTKSASHASDIVNSHLSGVMMSPSKDAGKLNSISSGRLI